MVLVAALAALSYVVGAAALAGPWTQGSTGCPAPDNGVYPPIYEQYFIAVPAGPNGAQPVLSSNQVGRGQKQKHVCRRHRHNEALLHQTLAPFSAAAMPIEEFFPKPKEQTHPTVCDAYHRCIAAFEIIANITVADMGFKDLQTGKPLLSQFITYDGTFPGPQINVPQGVQSLVRLRNFIGCDTSTMTPMNTTGTFYEEITGLTLHLHGAATVSPFDGWTADFVQPCQWKDYVYDNSGFLEALWYHDHAMGVTAQSVACGLAGTYQVHACDMSQIPAPLQPLYPPQYLVFSDQLFIQEDGSDYMNPDMFQKKFLYNVQYENKTYPVTGIAGDHVIVNGLPWPVVTVQRKSYWFIFHNAAQIRVFFANLYVSSTGQSVNALPGRIFVVGSDGGLRVQAVQAPDGILIGMGERYQVVIDFSQFDNGTELVLHNDLVPLNYAPDPDFCYTNLMMKFIVVGDEPLTPPFDPFYLYQPQTAEGQNKVVANTIERACNTALNGGADIELQTANAQLNGNNVKFFANWNDTGAGTMFEWKAIMLGTPGDVVVGRKLKEELPKVPTHRKLRGAVSPKRRSAMMQMSNTMSNGTTVSTFLPHSLATNGWSTWRIYNNVTGAGGGGPHPIHLHLVQMYMCGRNNAVTGGVRDYELFTPKDVFFVGPTDEVAWITRVGPHQGEYQFHCHNLQHEDDGLMGLFNSTDPYKPQIKTTYWHGLLEPNRTAGFELVPNSVKLYKGTDPLVYSYKKYPYIGHDLYNYDSMPPWAQRTDPNNPKLPQPITETLLRKVLKRGYYEVFYPNNRIGFSKPVKNNPYAFVCPNLPYSPAK